MSQVSEWDADAIARDVELVIAKVLRGSPLSHEEHKAATRLVTRLLVDVHSFSSAVQQIAAIAQRDEDSAALR